jgi:chromosome segregation ATPase
MAETDCRVAPEATLKEELLALIHPLEGLVANRLEKVKTEQAELLEKISVLVHEFEAIESSLPQTDLDAVTDTLNGYCDRIEKLRKRVAAVTKRAESILTKPAKPRLQAGLDSLREFAEGLKAPK